MERLENSKTVTVDPARPGKKGSAAAASVESSKNAVPAGLDPLATPATFTGAALMSSGKSTSKTNGGKATSAKSNSTKAKLKPVTKSTVDNRLDKIETLCILSFHLK